MGTAAGAAKAREARAAKRQAPTDSKTVEELTTEHQSSDVRLPVLHEGNSALAPLKGVDPKAVLQRYLSDETTKQIAADYGVTRQALGQFLLKHAEDEWKEAQVARALARKESAEDDLDIISAKINASDREERDRLTLTLSLARERLKAAQWDLERVCRRIYGQENAQGGPTVQINIANLRGPQLDVVGPDDVRIVDQSK